MGCPLGMEQVDFILDIEEVRAARKDTSIAAYSFLVKNSGLQQIRVNGKYPIDPGETFGFSMTNSNQRVVTVLSIETINGQAGQWSVIQTKRI